LLDTAISVLGRNPFPILVPILVPILADKGLLS